MNPIPPWHAEVVADTIGQHDRIITCIACIPNAIHQEILRHRSFSFSVESQRAVPAQEFRQRLIQDGPYIPPFLARSPSMQGKKGLVCDIDQSIAKNVWQLSFRHACQMHQFLESFVHKSIANRLLAPFAWTRMIITGSEWAWNHFFTLRCSPQADVAIQAVAAQLLRAVKKSQPRQHHYHLPFVDHPEISENEALFGSLLSAARCASISYGGIREKSVDQLVEMALELMKNCHWSPFEHQALLKPADTMWPGHLHSREWITARSWLETPKNRIALRSQLQHHSPQYATHQDHLHEDHDVNPTCSTSPYESAHAILPGGTQLTLENGQLVEVEKE